MFTHVLKHYVLDKGLGLDALVECMQVRGFKFTDSVRVMCEMLSASWKRDRQAVQLFNERGPGIAHQQLLFSLKFAFMMPTPGRGAWMFVYKVPVDGTQYNNATCWPPGLAVVLVWPQGHAPRMSEPVYIGLPRTAETAAELSDVEALLGAIAESGAAQHGHDHLVCPVCHERFCASEAMAACQSCSNVVHRNCVDNWFARSKSCSCPCCRNAFQAWSYHAVQAWSYDGA